MGSFSSDSYPSLADAACIHAWEYFKIRISLNSDFNSLVQVDQVLDACRCNPDPSELESIILCYGAWLGEWIRIKFSGRWIGWNESIAPRMLVHCEIVSPLDAVRRRLTSEESPTLQTLVAKLVQQAPSESSATVQAANQAAWNQRATDPRFAYLQPWSMSKEQALSAVDPWLMADGSLDNRRVLCLAAGGGTHGPLLAMAGADVVVVDFSLSLLQIDQRIAEQNRLRLRTVHTSMDDLSAFESAAFDCVVQPVSTCYVQDVERVYREIARVLRSGGLYVSQHKNAYSLQGDEQPTGNGYNLRVPCISGRTANPTKHRSATRESEMTETIHSIDSLIGGLCRCGFVVEDVVEPPHADAWAAEGTPEHRAQFLPPYLKIKARRRAGSTDCLVP